MESAKLIQLINIAMISIEERRGIIQKFIKFIGEVLNKLSRWLQPRRR